MEIYTDMCIEMCVGMLVYGHLGLYVHRDVYSYACDRVLQVHGRFGAALELRGVLDSKIQIYSDLRLRGYNNVTFARVTKYVAMWQDSSRR